MAGLAKSKNAKDCGDLTVLPLGYVSGITKQTITNTLNHILESGLLEEKDVSGEFLCDLVYRMPPQDGDTVTHTHVDYSERKGHNTLARNIKELISNMDKV
jgi:hypothetical protein